MEYSESRQKRLQIIKLHGDYLLRDLLRTFVQNPLLSSLSSGTDPVVSLENELHATFVMREVTKWLRKQLKEIDNRLRVTPMGLQVYTTMGNGVSLYYVYVDVPRMST